MTDLKLRDRANAYAAEAVKAACESSTLIDGEPALSMTDVRTLVARALVVGFGAGMESEATRRLCGEMGEVLA